MSTGKIIVAMTVHGVIGVNGVIPWVYPADMKRFRRLTINHTVIMGRKTWDSLPIQPLPDRQNIVVTRKSSPDVEHYSSLEEAIENANSDIWFIGGGELYKSAIDYTTLVDVTYVPDKIRGNRCTYFPEIDFSKWHVTRQTKSEEDEKLIHQQFYVN